MKRRVTIFSGILMSFLLVGVAFAAWTATATGNGRARAKTAQPLVVSPATGEDDLYPGGSGDLNFTVHNPNPYPVTLTEGTTLGVRSSNEAACPASNVSLRFPTLLGIRVPGTSPGEPVELDNAVSMSMDAPDGCQGASFDFTIRLTGTQG